MILAQVRKIASNLAQEFRIGQRLFVDDRELVSRSKRAKQFTHVIEPGGRYCERQGNRSQSLVLRTNSWRLARSVWAIACDTMIDPINDYKHQNQQQSDTCVDAGTVDCAA